MSKLKVAQVEKPAMHFIVFSGDIAQRQVMLALNLFAVSAEWARVGNRQVSQECVADIIPSVATNHSYQVATIIEIAGVQTKKAEILKFF